MNEKLVQLGLPAVVSRRRAMQWVMAAVAASQFPPAHAKEVGRTVTPQEEAVAHAATRPTLGGYGVDPNLVKVYKPGECWPLLMTPEQRKTAKALADVILPNDQYGPAASEVGVVEMIDEWVSSPYPAQQADHKVILPGLDWLEKESASRFARGFAQLSDDQQSAICEDICYAAEAKAAFKKPAHFFARFRSLAASAYYATPQGWKAIGYVGNTPLDHFEGPPADVLAKLGLS